MEEKEVSKSDKLPRWIDLLFWSGFLFSAITIWIGIKIMQVFDFFKIPFRKIDSDYIVIIGLIACFISFMYGIVLFRKQIGKWVKNNIKCPRCKAVFTECKMAEVYAWTLGYPVDAFCYSCKGVYRGYMDKNREYKMVRKPFTWSYGEDLKFEYVLPSKVIFSLLSKILFISLALSIFYILSYILFFTLFPPFPKTHFSSYWIDYITIDFVLYYILEKTLRKNILANLKCPKCKSKFESFNYRYSLDSFMGFDAYCSNCQTKFILKTGFFDKTFRIKKVLQKTLSSD